MHDCEINSLLKTNVTEAETIANKDSNSAIYVK